MQTIDMGGFENTEIEVIFAGKTYKIQSDPPVEVYRLYTELIGIKFDSEDNFNKLKNFVATIISVNNPGVDKAAFVKSLTKPAAINFINAYADVIQGGGQKKAVETPGKQMRKT